ncbi:MAG: TlpA disulfide reductase family protein [Nocardioides sp.]
MIRGVLATCVAAVVLLATGGCSLHGVNGTDGKDYVGGDGTVKQIPVADRGKPIDFSGKDLTGKPLSLSSMRGQPTVISIWWSNCPPCRREAPLLVGAQKQIGDRAHFVGVDVRDLGTAAPKTFQSQFGIPWPSFYSPNGEALLAFPGTLTPNSIPATVVLDDQGRVAASIIGAVPSQLTLVEVVKQVAAGG